MGVTRPRPFMPLELTCGAQSRPHIGTDIAAPPGRSVPEIVEGFFGFPNFTRLATCRTIDGNDAVLTESAQRQRPRAVGPLN